MKSLSTNFFPKFGKARLFIYISHCMCLSCLVSCTLEIIMAAFLEPHICDSTPPLHYTTIYPLKKKKKKTTFIIFLQQILISRLLQIFNLNLLLKLFPYPPITISNNLSYKICFFIKKNK